MAILTTITYEIRIKKSDDSYYYPPKAKTYEPAIEDLFDESTKRSAKGKLNTSRIGSFPDLILEVGILDATQMSELLQLLRPLPVTIDWFDPELGNYRTDLEVYCKTRRPKLIQRNPILYEPMKFTLTAYDKVV